MRYKTLFLCLILLSFTFACTNKSSDQASSTPANTTTPATQPATPEPSTPPAAAPATSTPATSEKPAHNPATSRKLAPAAASTSKPSAVPAAPLVIPAGTSLSVRLQDSLSSETNHAGDPFTATVMTPVLVDGKEVIPAHSDVKGTVTDAQAKGKIKGEARLKLALHEVTINGRNYPIQTSMTGFSEQGKGKRTAVTTGGGAAVGALIGGLTGGGKGAAIGALVGGGAGLAGGALTGNKQIELPSETALTFKLTEPVTLK